MISRNSSSAGVILKSRNCLTAEQYTAGALEDWVPGAVAFDGKRAFALSNERLTRDFTVGADEKKRTITGKDRKTVRMTDNNFAIEAVYRVEPGAAMGNIAGKLDSTAGYALGIDGHGRLLMAIRGGGQEMTQASSVKVNDGRWHHVLAEVDRGAGRITIYVDGVAANGTSQGSMSAGVSLDNSADFVVGEKLVGELDYLRVSRGTLADSQTTIEELMAWQFRGPARHDFAGRPPTGASRDIGALEHPTIGGQQPIRYTPPVPVADSTAAPAADPETLKTGADRLVKALDWGTVSVPKQAKLGEKIDIQVVFGTESVEKAQKLLVDFHAQGSGRRVPGYGRAKAQDVTPGSTKPYTALFEVRPRDELTAVIAVIYVTPDGTYEKKTYATEVSIPIVQAAAAAGGASAPAAEVGKGPVKTENFDWGTITIPDSVAVGQKFPVSVTFKDDAIKQKGDLRIDLHWWKGKTRAGVLTSARHPNAKSGETVVKEFTVPAKEDITRIAVIVYVAPGGEYAKKFVSGSTGSIPVRPAEDAPAKAEPPAIQEAPEPAAADVQQKVTEWGTLQLTRDAKVGNEVVATVTLKQGVVTEPTVLTVDMHWWKGAKRAGVAGKFGQKRLQPGDTGPFEFRKLVPENEGIAAIAAVVSLSPDGSWAKKTHSGEVSTRVKGK